MTTEYETSLLVSSFHLYTVSVFRQDATKAYLRDDGGDNVISILEGLAKSYPPRADELGQLIADLKAIDRSGGAESEDFVAVVTYKQPMVPKEFVPCSTYELEEHWVIFNRKDGSRLSIPARNIWQFEIKTGGVYDGND